MRGVAARRRVAHFGWSYEFATFKLGAAPPIPEFLSPLRERVGELTSRRPAEFAEVLVTEYSVGAGIGWHRDAPPFDIVAGISLLSECKMHFRPRPPAHGRAAPGRKGGNITRATARPAFRVSPPGSRPRGVAAPNPTGSQPALFDHLSHPATPITALFKFSD